MKEKERIKKKVKCRSKKKFKITPKKKSSKKNNFFFFLPFFLSTHSKIQQQKMDSND